MRTAADGGPTIEDVDPADARALQRAAMAARKNIGERDRLIVKMHEDGASLRTLAELAGLSHMGIKRVLERSRRSDADNG